MTFSRDRWVKGKFVLLDLTLCKSKSVSSSAICSFIWIRGAWCVFTTAENWSPPTQCAQTWTSLLNTGRQVKRTVRWGRRRGRGDCLRCLIYEVLCQSKLIIIRWYWRSNFKYQVSWITTDLETLQNSFPVHLISLLLSKRSGRTSYGDCLRIICPYTFVFCLAVTLKAV
jgi:hypothetical protein